MSNKLLTTQAIGNSVKYQVEKEDEKLVIERNSESVVILFSIPNSQFPNNKQQITNDK